MLSWISKLDFMKIKNYLFHLLGDKYTWLAIHYRQAQTYTSSVLHPYHYDAERYAACFGRFLILMS